MRRYRNDFEPSGKLARQFPAVRADQGGGSEEAIVRVIGKIAKTFGHWLPCRKSNAGSRSPLVPQGKQTNVDQTRLSRWSDPHKFPTGPKEPYRVGPDCWRIDNLRNLGERALDCGRCCRSCVADMFQQTERRASRAPEWQTRHLNQRQADGSHGRPYRRNEVLEQSEGWHLSVAWSPSPNLRGG